MLRILNQKKKHLNQHIRAVFSTKQPKKVILLSGIQRSGTNMIEDILESSVDIDMFRETDKRVFGDYELDSLDTLYAAIAKSPAPTVAFKLLLDSDMIGNLLESLPQSKVIWIYRQLDDTVKSNITKWPDGKNELPDIVLNRDYSGWRGRSISDETHAILTKYFSPEMSIASAQALFWYHRHMLFFDQNLHLEQRVLLLNYEELVRHPLRALAVLSKHVDIELPQHPAKKIFSTSVGKEPMTDIDEGIRELCNDLWENLQKHQQKP